MLIGEYLNWTVGNAIVPHENPRKAEPSPTSCSVHRWFEGSELRCTYCGVRVCCSCGLAVLGQEDLTRLPLTTLFGRQATLDHLIPTSRGGPEVADNLAVACRTCNSSKQDLLFPGEWIPDRDNHTYLSAGDPLPPHTTTSNGTTSNGTTARGMTGKLARMIASLDPESPMSVAEICRNNAWRPSHVHRALEGMLRAKAAYVFAFPCWPPSRYFRPVRDPGDIWAGAVWVDGWL